MDSEYLQKRSTLNPKSYNSTLQLLLQTVDPSTVISSQSVSKYYGSPAKLKEMIEEIQRAANDSSPLAALAAAYQITQISGLKTCGTIGAMALLWAQPADLLKEVSTSIKPFCDSAKIKESAKAINEEIRQTRAFKVLHDDTERVGLGQKRSSSPRLAANKKEKTSPPSPSSTLHDSQSSSHPLLLLNCSCNGPAFGPIIL